MPDNFERREIEIERMMMVGGNKWCINFKCFPEVIRLLSDRNSLNVRYKARVFFSFSFLFCQADETDELIWIRNESHELIDSRSVGSLILKRKLFFFKLRIPPPFRLPLCYAQFSFHLYYADNDSSLGFILADFENFLFFVPFNLFSSLLSRSC